MLVFQPSLLQQLPLGPDGLVYIRPIGPVLPEGGFHQADWQAQGLGGRGKVSGLGPGDVHYLPDIGSAAEAGPASQGATPEHDPGELVHRQSLLDAALGQDSLGQVNLLDLLLELRQDVRPGTKCEALSDIE